MFIERNLSARGFAAWALTASAVLFGALVSVEGAADTSTQVFKQVTSIFPGDTNPCTGDTGTSTFTYDGVAHSTITPGGQTVVKVNLNGDLSFVADNAGRPSYSGHFVSNSTNTFSQNGETQTATFITKLTGSDGSTERFQVTTHLTMNSGGVAISFDKPRCF